MAEQIVDIMEANMPVSSDVVAAARSAGGTAGEEAGRVAASVLVSGMSHRVFNTVQDMKNDSLLTNGMTCETLGFHQIGDGGAAFYQIINNQDTNDIDIIACQNNLNAQIVQDNNIYNARKYGAYGDGTHDDTNILLYLTKKQNSIIYIPSGKYICNQTINLGANSSIIGDNITNTSVNDSSTYILSQNLPKTDEHGTPALLLTWFNTVKNISIVGNQWTTQENRDAIQPRVAPDYGNWMTQQATDTTLRTTGIKSTAVNLLENVNVKNFYTGYTLSSQGYADTLGVSKCVQGYEISGDFRLNNALAASCINGFFFGGGNVEISNLRCDGIFNYAYQMYYGGSFENLSADFIGNQMILTVEFEGTINNIRLDRCCVNYSSTNNEATNTRESFGIVLINPVNTFINTALICDPKSIADNSTSPIAKYKTLGKGIVLVASGETGNINNFTAYIESNTIDPTKQTAYTDDEKNKLIYIDTSSAMNRMYGYVHFRNTTFTITQGTISTK